MKERVYKYITVGAIILVSILILCNWFVIKTDDGMKGSLFDAQAHSFMNLPDMINDGADSLAKILGAGVTAVILLVCAILKYLCLLVSAFGIWGSVRTFMHGRKSGFIFSSQVIAVSLMSIAGIIMIGVNIISNSAMSGMISAVPTIWYILCAVSLIVSIVFSKLHSIEVARYYAEYDEEYEEYYDTEDESNDDVYEDDEVIYESDNDGVSDKSDHANEVYDEPDDASAEADENTDTD